MAIQVEQLTADYTGMIVQADYEEYLRFSGTDQDTILPVLIDSAISQAEQYCNATFGAKTFKYQREEVDSGCNYYLPFAPIRTVTSVKVIDTDGIETTLTDGVDYIVRGLNRKYITFLRSVLRGVVEVEYSAGNETPANVDPHVKEAILKILSENFEDRQEGIEGSMSTMPRTSRVLLAPFRNNVY